MDKQPVNQQYQNQYHQHYHQQRPITFTTSSTAATASNFETNAIKLALSFLILLITYYVYKKLQGEDSDMGKFSEMLSMNNYLYKSHNPDRSQLNRDPAYKKLFKNAILRGGFPGGLANDGNTCFMNSVIQSLSSSSEFIKFLESYTATEEDNDFDFSKALLQLLNELNDKHGNKTPTYKTKNLLKVMTDGPNKHLFMGYNQEDAQEFYQSLMKQIEKEYSTYLKGLAAEPSEKEDEKEKESPKLTDKEKDELRKKLYVEKNDDLIMGIDQLGQLGPVYIPVSQLDPSDVVNEDKFYPYQLITPIDGLQCDRIGCIECGEMGGIRYSINSGLGLNLPMDGINRDRFTLGELMDDWTKTEIIDGVQCNRCGLIYMKEKIQEQINQCLNNERLISMFKSRIEEIDKVLNLKSIPDEIYERLHTENNLKKSQKVKQSFLSRPPPLLSIHINRSVFDPNTYMVKKNPAKIDFPIELDLNDFVALPNDINMDGRLSFRKQDQEDEGHVKHNQLKYQLKAVVSHFGTHNYGHYIAFKKIRGNWWRISDEIVRLSTEEEVLESPGTFMLYYEMPPEEPEVLEEAEEEEEEDEEDDDDEKDELESISRTGEESEIVPPEPEYEETESQLDSTGSESDSESDSDSESHAHSEESSGRGFQA